MKKKKNGNGKGLIVLVTCFLIMAMLIGVMIETDRQLNKWEPDVVYEMCNKNISWG